MQPVAQKALFKRLLLPLCITLAVASCAQLSKQDSAAEIIDEQANAVTIASVRAEDELDNASLTAEAPEVVETLELAEAMPIGLWQRLRDGFALTPETMPASVVKQRDWYLRNPSYLKTVFGRAEPFIFYVTEQLAEAGLPLELALLPIVESTYDPLAYSHSHAVGLWQFIPSTGESLGLRRDRWYDGRRDVIDSTDAAITYLTRLHNRFDNDWLLALAAYNSG